MKDIVFNTHKESAKPMKSAEIAAQAGIEKVAANKAEQALKIEERIISQKCVPIPLNRCL